MRARLQVWCTFMVVSGSAAFSRPAHACECAVPGVTLPRDGSVDVPVNTLVWLAGFLAGSNAPVLAEDNGPDVPITCVQLGDTTRCTPQQPLRPLTTYRVRPTQHAFTTGASRDDENPALPTEKDRHVFSTSGTPPFGGASSCSNDSAGGAVAVSLEGGDAILLLDASGNQDPAPPEAPTVMAARVGSAPAVTLTVGSYNCTSNRPTEPGERFPLRAASFDVAGNFSGWVPLEDAEIPPAAPGCSHADGAFARAVPGGPFVLVALLLLAGRNARRRSAAPGGSP